MTTEPARAVGPSGPAARALPRWRLLLASAAVVVFAATTTLAVRTFTDPGRLSSVETATDTGAAASHEQGIPALQRRLYDVPGDARAWAALGGAYVQQARITGDPTYYPKAERSLDRALALDPKTNFEAMAGMGALAAARHDFAEALRWGERARAINPYNANIYGVIGDALIELGRYPEAFAALQRMQNLRPGLSSYARASYAWELQGDLPNATSALKLALQAATIPADAAFASYYLGELAWNAGRVTEAERWYRQSAAHDATFVPAAQGLAKIDAARGRLDAAIAAYAGVVDRLPLPQYVIELADLYRLAGKESQASQEIDLLRVQERLFRANGVNIDLEQALFDADHGTDLAAGLAAARAEWSRRRSVFVADALAWSLYANGRHREALSYSKQALRLGTRNALFYFHRGMIERALGERAAARRDLRKALSINPNFSFLWGPRIPTILASL